jgi:hypothetical protein
MEARVFVLETNELKPPQLAFVPYGLKNMCGSHPTHNDSGGFEA